MTNYEYKCVPFIANVKVGLFSQDNAGTIASQLESIINQNATEDWEFHGVSQVQTLVKPGCLGSLMGNKEITIPYDLVIFKKPK